MVIVALNLLLACAAPETVLDPLKVNRTLVDGIARREDWQPNDSVLHLFPDAKWEGSLVGKHVEPARFVRGSVRQSGGETGEVKVALIVSPTGSVDEARVVSSTNPRLDRIVLDSVKRWQFAPGRINGEPSAFVYVYPIAFE